MFLYVFLFFFVVDGNGKKQDSRAEFVEEELDCCIKNVFDVIKMADRKVHFMEENVFFIIFVDIANLIDSWSFAE